MKIFSGVLGMVLAAVAGYVIAKKTSLNLPLVG